MAIPCEQENNIKDIKDDVASVVNSISRMCESNDRLAKEMREMSQTVINHMVSNREFSVRLDNVEKSDDVLFNRWRKVEEDILPSLIERVKGVEGCSAYMKDIPLRVQNMEAWQNRMKGMLLIFPGVCTAVATLASIVAIYISLKGA